jgi:Effector-associated domain 1/von Willebrand factor type A domain
MALSGPQQAQIVEAFLAAFPRYPNLRFMLSTQLEENIEAIAPLGSSLKDCVFELVIQMEARGRLKELLRGALNDNPKNPHLIGCGVDFGVYTALESASLPPLHLGEFSYPVNDALFAHRNVELTVWFSDYYREECLIAASDARHWGISENTLYAVLSIQTLSLDKPVQQVAVRLLVDEHVKPGSLCINQQFGESIGLLSHDGRSWFICKAKDTVRLKEIVFELRVERAKVDNEISTLREHYRDIFMHRPLLLEHSSSLRDSSFHVHGLGYFTVHAIEPSLREYKPETLLLLDDKTTVQLLVPHQKSAVDMVILVDVSGSMTIEDYVGDDNLPHSRLDGVQLALETLIERCLLSGGCRVSRLAILAFGNTTAMLYPPRPVMEELNSVEKIKQIRLALQQNLSPFGLRALKVDRNPTNISAVLSAAADVLNWSFLEETEKVLILLSDGANWDERTDPGAEGEIVSAAEDPVALADSLHSNSDIRIHAVAISNEEAYRSYCEKAAHEAISGLTPNIPLLRKIAASADGIFFESPDAKSLNRLFDELGRGAIYPLT